MNDKNSFVKNLEPTTLDGFLPHCGWKKEVCCVHRKRTWKNERMNLLCLAFINKLALCFHSLSFSFFHSYFNGFQPCALSSNS